MMHSKIATDIKYANIDMTLYFEYVLTHLWWDKYCFNEATKYPE